ncbi:hypothetical protein D3C77_271570 [compost metagenome]
MWKRFSVAITRSSSLNIDALVPKIPILDGDHLTTLLYAGMGTEEGKRAEFGRVQATHLEDLPNEEQLVRTILPVDEAVSTLRIRPNLHASPLP